MTTNRRTKRGHPVVPIVRRAVVVTLLLLINSNVLMAVPLRLRKQGQQPVKNSKQIIGLLELPSVFLPDESDVAADAELPAQGQPIRAYSKRSTESSIVAVIQGPEDIETREDPYKRACAVVYDALSNWYLIGLKPHGLQLKAWVHVENSNAFKGLDLLILLADASCYVTPEWDGELWTSPGNRSKVLLLNRPATRDITVVNTKGYYDELWLQVEFTERVSCDWKELPPVVARGWIRAYTKSGKLQFWFYPRGDC
jgi:hypothetical protein